MRYAITLAAIPLPLLMWVAWPKAAPQITVRAVQTEGVTARRLDDTTFSARWHPVIIPLPAAMPSRVSTIAADETLAGSPSTAARQPSRRIVRRASLRGDVCARHGMRKTMVGKYRWRCRR